MKLNNREMRDIYRVLNEIGQKEGIDFVLGVTIARNNIELSKMLEPVEKAETALLNECAAKDENGKMITNGTVIRLADGDKYNAQKERLMNAECEVNLTKFSMDELKKMSPTPNQIMYLFPILEEEKK